MKRYPVVLSGGPLHTATVFAPLGAVELAIRFKDKFLVYEIKGRHGSFIEERSVSAVLSEYQLLPYAQE